MEFDSIVEFLENKTILVTGATGYLAKIFVEKILRIQPNVKKLVLVLRAIDAKLAAQRFQEEVIGKELFDVLREKLGSNFNSLISEKVLPIPGDISCKHLGIKDSNLREEMWREIDVIISSAATTNFDERYDVALGTNTLGARNVVSFARKCTKLKKLLHVSTAYVCGERSGSIIEKPLFMGETLNGTSGLSIEAEIKLVEESLSKLRGKGSTEEEITSAMKDLGINRARFYGWPNTYAFTKAMGEMLLGHSKENLPLVIIRPTIITSTYKEPFPGWIEGFRTLDSIAILYGKGKIPCFLGDPETILDVVPADMVVNLMVIALVAHANQSSQIIYHAGSSMRNPMKLSQFLDFIFHYFTKNPWINKRDGKPVKVGKRALLLLSTMASFRIYILIHYLLPLKGFQLVNTISCQYFGPKYINVKRKIKLLMRATELYKPYVLFKGIFDDTNTAKLGKAARESNVKVEVFNFDPTCIDWEDYFMNTHIPGIIKYVCK